MKKTKLILTRAALMSLFVMLCSPAWAQLFKPGDPIVDPDPGPKEKYDLTKAVVVVNCEGKIVTLNYNETGIPSDAEFEADEEAAEAKHLTMTYTGDFLEPEVVSVICARKEGNGATIETEVLDWVDVDYSDNRYADCPYIKAITPEGKYQPKFTITPKEGCESHFASEGAGPGHQAEQKMEKVFTINPAPFHIEISIAEDYSYLYTALPIPEEENWDAIYSRYYNGVALADENGAANEDELVFNSPIDEFDGHSLTFHPSIATNDNQWPFINAGQYGWIKPYMPHDNLTTIKIEKGWDELDTQAWPSSALSSANRTYDVSGNFKFEWENVKIIMGALPVTVVVNGTVVPAEGEDPIYYDGENHQAVGYTVTATTTVEGYEGEIPLNDIFTYRGPAKDYTVATVDAKTVVMQISDDPEAWKFGTNNFVFAEDVEKPVIVNQGSVKVLPLEGVTVTITGEQRTEEYNAEEQTAEGYTALVNNELYLVNKYATYTGEAVATLTEPGKEYMGLAAKDFINTNNNFKDVTFTIAEDGYMEVTKAIVNATITGHTDKRVYNGNYQLVSGYDFFADNKLFTADKYTFSGKAEARRKDVGTTNMKLKVTQFENNEPEHFDVTWVISDGGIEIAYQEVELANAANNTTVINNVYVNCGKMADVYLKGRTITAGEWNTICLPFDVTIADSEFDGATVLEMDTENTTYDATTGALSLNFNLTPVTVIEAGKPYIIKSDTKLEDIYFDAVTFSRDLQDVTADLGDGKSITFKGTYAPVTFEEANSNVLLVGAGNTVFTPGAGSLVNAQRAYFVLEGFEEAEEAPAFVLNFGGTTNISNVNMEKASNEYFDLSGRRVAQPTEKGIYIMNGKKVVVK